MERKLVFLIALFFAVAVSASPNFAQKLKAEDVVAKHLESIGSAEARAAAKTRIAAGDAVVTFLSEKNQTAQGRVVIASAGEKNFFGLSLDATDYPGDRFSFDGSKPKAAIISNIPRSYLNIFVNGYGPALRDSLLTGALASSWALADLAGKKARISGGGLKKIDGKELYALNYSPKGGGDYDVTLFFDKDNFRHVRTEYKRTSSAAIGTSPDQSGGFTETRVKIVETFSDFKPQGGLMLPNRSKLVYTETGARGTREIEWAYTLTEFAFNQALDANTFDVDAK